MKTISPVDIPALLKQHGLRPDRGLGQNFLVDETALNKIIAAAEISPEQDVLEIGAGLGNLTHRLALVARQVVAVELDQRLISPLREVIRDLSNVTVIQGDILALDISIIMPGVTYLVVANIPYYITSAVLRHLLENKPPPIRSVLTVQREVAQRICAGPGEMSLLALSVQVYGQPQIKGTIPAGAFYPPPKVDSAVIRIDLFQEPRIPSDQLNPFFRLAKAGFSQKRKNLRNALAGGMGWSKDEAVQFLQTSGIDPARRAETLSLDEWASLTQSVRKEI
jgi:16S rRNA (adenine1518-N6/adenine1519-N6)-dimethyltransferase